MKKIELIPIARKKLERRGIKEEWVRETIDSPDQVVDGYGGRRVGHRKYMIEDKEYLLRVIFEEKEDFVIILTAYLTSQVKRYWREEKHEN
jgi:hypothetical protein